MWLTTIVYGDLLIALGVVGYYLTGGVTTKAWIPAAMGGVLQVLGVLARSDKYRKHVMHTAVLLALVACLGSLPGILQLSKAIEGDATVHAVGVYVKTVVAVVSGVFLLLCVRSFAAARRPEQ